MMLLAILILYPMLEEKPLGKCNNYLETNLLFALGNNQIVNIKIIKDIIGEVIDSPMAC